MNKTNAKQQVEQFVGMNLAKNTGFLNEGVVAIQYLSESTYIGYVDDLHQKQGKGVYKYSNQDMYWGNWRDDCFHGEGVYQFSDGTRFSGYFQNGKCARGIIQQQNGGIYQGEIRNGLKNGRGVMKYANGDRYEGNWKDGVENGRGKYISIKNIQVLGFWNGSENCSSCMINGPGLQFQGSMKDGMLTGHIKVNYSAYHKYSGAVVNSRREGEGTYTLDNKNHYVGLFKNDLPNGWGILNTNEGVYEGYFVDCLPNGFGRYRGLDGEIYEGNWRHGEKHGRGKTIFSNGDVHEGEYHDGFRQGKGFYCWYQSSRSYQGEFNQDLCNGFGRIKENDFEYQGIFKQNKPLKSLKQGQTWRQNNKRPFSGSY